MTQEQVRVTCEMMFLLFFDNVASERELMRIIQLRIQSRLKKEEEAFQAR